MLKSKLLYIILSIFSLTFFVWDFWINFEKMKEDTISSSLLKTKTTSIYLQENLKKFLEDKTNPEILSIINQTFNSDFKSIKVDNSTFEIKEEDLEVKACRASWAWGQHVNKTDSAIHMTHIPTWVSVFCQEWRSQHKNRERALQILRSKIYTMEEERQIKERWEQRLAQVWSWDRSEKIRTYNFPQDRVTDHRIGQNFSGIPLIMAWRLWPIIDALGIADEQMKLQQASWKNQA